MALPVVRQQDATQVRMAVKDHAEQIERLALVPVCRTPNAGDALDMRVFLVQQHLQANAMVFSCGEEMVIDFEAGFFFYSAIHAADIRQEIELSFRPGF